MGKANKEKNKKKTTKVSAQQQVLHWENLMDFVGFISHKITYNTALVAQLAKEYTNEIAKDENLGNLIKGFSLSLEDLAKETRAIMERHITFENDKIVENRKGIVNQENDEIFDFLAISNMYIELQDKVSVLSSQGYLNIFMKLKAYNVDKVKEFEKIAEGLNNGTNTTK